MYSSGKMGSLATPNSYYTNSLENKTRGNMEYEVERLASFHTWPDWSAKRPTELAENGFFYCGNGEEVKCFSCGGLIRDWSIDSDVASEHSKRFPTCAIVLGNADDNKKLGTGYKRLSPLSLADTEAGSITMQYVGDASQDFDKSGASGGLEEAEKFLEQMASQAFLKQKYQSDSLPKEHPQSDGLELDPDLLRYEFYRRQTFDGKWPKNSLTSPSELAKAGFYYFGPGDMVKCAFCKGRLLNWKPTDNAMSEHRKHYPQCPFVRGEAFRNVAIESIKNSNKPVKQSEQQKKQSACERLGVLVDKPKYPEYALESARENSFKNWPKDSNIRVQDLVKAGFFFVGISDNVKCFFCGGGLRNWEVGDEPWSAHARWYSRCGFVKLNKGEDFIEKAKNPLSAAVGTDSSLLGASSNTVQEMSFDPAEVDAWLEKPDVKSLISMGFSVNLIRKVIENKLKTTGEMFRSISDLIDAVIKENVSTEMTKGSKSRRKKKNKNRRKKNAASSATVSEVALPFLATAPSEKGTEDEEVAVPELDELLSNPSAAGDEELTRLHEEYQKLKEQTTCKICMNAESSVAFLPCGHIICCTTCAPALRNCPLCRAYIKGSVRTFFP